MQIEPTRVAGVLVVTLNMIGAHQVVQGFILDVAVDIRERSLT